MKCVIFPKMPNLMASVGATRTFLIAEAGSSHDGDLDKATCLILAAKRAGADAVKFQTYHAETLARQRNAPNALPSYRRYEMALDWLPVLKGECDEAGIEFMTTCYHVDYLPIIAPHVARFKISSFEAGGRGFLAAHVPYRKPLVISTGMMTGEEVRELSNRLLDQHLGAEAMRATVLLHCTSAYPCPLDQANLWAIGALKDCWGGPVGLSDHTAHEWTGALAVAAGARVIEVHFRLDETDPTNPDYPHSLTPEQLRAYVEHVRLAETMLGATGIKAPQAAERPLMPHRVQGGG